MGSALVSEGIYMHKAARLRGSVAYFTGDDPIAIPVSLSSTPNRVYYRSLASPHAC